MRAHAVLAAGTWDPAREGDAVSLDYDHRHRRRIVLRTVAGRDLLLDLPQPARLRDGDGLLLDDGAVVRVRACAERLMEIRGEPELLLRVAWHLGNRHLPVQVSAGTLLMRSDIVIGDMVRGLGGQVRAVEAAFEPEAGAYAPSGHSHHG